MARARRKRRNRNREGSCWCKNYKMINHSLTTCAEERWSREFSTGMCLLRFHFLFHSPRCHFKYAAPSRIISLCRFFKLTESSPHNVLEASVFSPNKAIQLMRSQRWSVLLARDEGTLVRGRNNVFQTCQQRPAVDRKSPCQGWKTFNGGCIIIARALALAADRDYTLGVRLFSCN